MLVKVLSHALASGVDYEKTLKARRNLSVLGIVLGLVVLVIVNLWKPEADLAFADFLKGVYTGTGIGLMLFSALFWVKVRKLLKDPELQKKTRIQEQDERQTLIAMKTSSSALLILIGLEYFALLLSGMFNATVFFTLLAVLIAVLVVMIGCKLYYSRPDLEVIHMGKCEKRAWPLTLGLLVNAVALVIHGLIENLPEGLFILMELAAIVLMLWGIVETRRRAGL